MLNVAGNGNIEVWCVYVLSGLKEEIHKIDKISNYSYIQKILEHALSKKYINNQIYDVLLLIINNKKMAITTGDISTLKNMDTNLKMSRLIKKIKDLKMIKSINGETSRTYTISFQKNILQRIFIQVLRGSVDGWDFKQYVLGILFYRYISENLTDYLNAYEHKAGDKNFDYKILPDEQAEYGRVETINEKGLYILPSELFVNVCKTARNNENLNETLYKVFNNIENSAKGAESEKKS